MKNVLVVSRELFPYSFGGLAKLMHEYLLRVQKFHYTAVTWYNKNRKDEELVEYMQIKPLNIFFWNRYLRAAFFSIMTLVKCFARNHDVIVGMGLNGCLLSVFLGLMNRKPSLSIVYDVDVLKDEAPTYGLIAKVFRRWVFRFIARFSDKIMCGSKKAEKDMTILFAVPQDKIIVNPPGLNLPLDEKVSHDAIKKNGSLMLLSVGSINPKEGFEFLIEAIKLIVEEVKNIKLFIVGGEVYQKYAETLKERVKKYNLSDYIIFTGRVEDVWPYYKAADIYLTASYYEKGFSMPVIEASSLGKPVITSSYLEEVGMAVGGVTGLVVPDKDFKALARATLKLIKDENLRKELGERGRVFAKKFSWDLSVEKFEDCLLRILDKHKGL